MSQNLSNGEEWWRDCWLPDFEVKDFAASEGITVRAIRVATDTESGHPQDVWVYPVGNKDVKTRGSVQLRYATTMGTRVRAARIFKDHANITLEGPIGIALREETSEYRRHAPKREEEAKDSGVLENLTRQLRLLIKVSFLKKGEWPDTSPGPLASEDKRMLSKLKEAIKRVYPDPCKVTARSWGDSQPDRPTSGDYPLILSTVEEILSPLWIPPVCNDRLGIRDEDWQTYLTYVEKCGGTPDISPWEWDWASRIPQILQYVGLNLATGTHPENILRIKCAINYSRLERGEWIIQDMNKFHQFCSLDKSSNTIDIFNDPECSDTYCTDYLPSEIADYLPWEISRTLNECTRESILLHLSAPFIRLWMVNNGFDTWLYRHLFLSTVDVTVWPRKIRSSEEIERIREMEAPQMQADAGFLNL